MAGQFGTAKANGAPSLESTWDPRRLHTLEVRIEHDNKWWAAPGRRSTRQNCVNGPASMRSASTASSMIAPQPKSRPLTTATIPGPEPRETSTRKVQRPIPNTCKTLSGPESAAIVSGGTMHAGNARLDHPTTEIHRTSLHQTQADSTRVLEDLGPPARSRRRRHHLHRPRRAVRVASGRHASGGHTLKPSVSAGWSAAGAP